MIIEFDLWDSKEINLCPDMPKQKRKTAVDDYDYDDEFIEKVEGELDPVYIDCNIDDFFIYSGRLTQDLKTIARKEKQKRQRKKENDQTNENTVNKGNLLEIEYQIKLGIIINTEIDENNKFEIFLQSLIADKTRKLMNDLNIRFKFNVDIEYLKDKYHKLKNESEEKFLELKNIFKCANCSESEEENKKKLFMENILLIMSILDLEIKLYYLDCFIYSKSVRKEDGLKSIIYNKISSAMGGFNSVGRCVYEYKKKSGLLEIKKVNEIIYQDKKSSDALSEKTLKEESNNKFEEMDKKNDPNEKSIQEESINLNEKANDKNGSDKSINEELNNKDIQDKLDDNTLEEERCIINLSNNPPNDNNYLKEPSKEDSLNEILNTADFINRDGLNRSIE
ncbi:hypothetical protein TCON_0078 [Astathelohania contejeani]|uniref:Hpc2-related domain-containing protein n=1 Tax=Astathelohania contejeani TaxID=164912 RepID=A0ABQ7I2K3_9MICR|nr:hypothetical protein TCON_0078 [Thelohania contejeani]